MTDILIYGTAAALLGVFFVAALLTPDEAAGNLAAGFAPLPRWLRRGKRRLPQSLRRPRTRRDAPRPDARHARTGAVA